MKPISGEVTDEARNELGAKLDAAEKNINVVSENYPDHKAHAEMKAKSEAVLFKLDNI